MNRLDVRSRLIATAWAVFFALVVVAGPLPARAQWEEDEIDEEQAARMDGYLTGDYLRHTPGIARSDIGFFARMAALSPEQREAALELYDSFRERHDRAALKLQEYENSLTGGDDSRLWGDAKISETLQPVRDDFNKFQTRARNDLVGDLKTVLTAEQEGRIEWFERRTMWSANTWQIAVMGAPHPDLGLLVHRAVPDGPIDPALMDVIGRYYTDSLKLAQDCMNADSEWSGKARALEDENARQAVETERKAHSENCRRKALELAQRTASRIRGLLPEQRADVFEERYLREMTRGSEPWDEVIRPERALAAAWRVKSLSEDQRSRLDSIGDEVRASEIRRMRKSLDDRLTKPLGEFPSRDQDPVAMMIAYREAQSAGKALLDRIRSVLTPEQQEEAGPPISRSTLRLPNFEDENEPAPPLMEPRPGMPDTAAMFSRRDLNDLDLAFLRRAAPLTEDQYSAARDLFDTYIARARLAERKMAAYMQAMTQRASKGDSADMLDKQQMRLYIQYEKYTRRIRDDLLADLRTLLTDEQTPAYESIVRRSKRRILEQNRVQIEVLGSRVDLVSLVEGTVPAAEIPEDVRAILARYEEDLAPLMSRLNAFADVQTRRFEKMTEGAGGMDISAMMGFFTSVEKDAEGMMVEARELNLKHFRELLPAMPEERRAELEEAFYSAAGPGRWMGLMERGTKSPRGLLDSAKALGDLSPEQVASLTVTAQRNTAETARVLRETFEAALAQENLNQNMMERMRARNYSDAYRRGRELKSQREKAVELMLTVLTEEQRSRLLPPYRPAAPIERPRFEEE